METSSGHVSVLLLLLLLVSRAFLQLISFCIYSGDDETQHGQRH